MPKKRFICDYCRTEFERYDIGSKLHFCCIEHRRIAGKMIAANFSDDFKNSMRNRCLQWNELIHKNPPLNKRLEIGEERRKRKPTHGYTKKLGRHEHRLVMEQVLGRPLKSTEIVHHKDGNKINNLHSNLEVMTQSEHARLHFSKRKRGGTNSNSIP